MRIFSSWQDVIWALKETKRKLGSTIEITKEDPRQYAQYALEQFLKKCDHWGVDKEEIKGWF